MTLSPKLLKNASAAYLAKLFGRVYKQKKYTNKATALQSLSKKRLTKKEVQVFERGLRSAIAYKKRKAKKLVVPRRSGKKKPTIRQKVGKKKSTIRRYVPKIIFELAYESQNFRYYRTPWKLGADVMSFDRYYRVPTQDFVEKHTRARFIGFKYDAVRMIGNLRQTSPDIMEYSPRFKYEQFFFPEEKPDFVAWVEEMFAMSLARKLDRYREDFVVVKFYYIGVEKETFE